MAELRKIPKGKFANHELVTIAILLLGGETKPADLEDIAMKVNQLAPGRFAWRKYASGTWTVSKGSACTRAAPAGKSVSTFDQTTRPAQRKAEK